MYPSCAPLVQLLRLSERPPYSLATVTRLSNYLLPTVKDAPADAEAASHKMMVRAGLIRQLGAGMWTYLPAGLRVLRKIEQILREEMDAIGGQEMLMPVLQPADLWQKTGRANIPELFKLEDRNQRELVLAMTHEENITFHVSSEISSYRELPKVLYQIQTKERDEPRPRAGILRTREFTMKDAYSFDRDENGLEDSYELHIEAYDRIFNRCGIEWHRVESDVGMMGGLGAHEYMAPCDAGENEIALCSCSYAANVEVALGEPSSAIPDLPSEGPVEVETPNARTIDEVSGLLDVDPSALIKALPYVLDSGETVLALVRGDSSLNEIKLQGVLGEPVRAATVDEIKQAFGAEPGFIGPVGVDSDFKIVADPSINDLDMVVGANRNGYHLRGVRVGRDFQVEIADIRTLEEGDACPKCGKELKILKAIEVGNIFKLGTRYSKALNATYLDDKGKEHPIVMGSYGIGPARIAAAAVEQRHDERGISWPRSIAPFEVEVVALGKEGSEETKLADKLYGELNESGFDVIYDDRTARAGEKFADAELLGCPVRLTVGKRTIKEGSIETQVRHGLEDRQLPIDALPEELGKLLDSIE